MFFTSWAICRRASCNVGCLAVQNDTLESVESFGLLAATKFQLPSLSEIRVHHEADKSIQLAVKADALFCVHLNKLSPVPREDWR